MEDSELAAFLALAAIGLSIPSADTIRAMRMGCNSKWKQDRQMLQFFSRQAINQLRRLDVLLHDIEDQGCYEHLRHEAEGCPGCKLAKTFARL